MALPVFVLHCYRRPELGQSRCGSPRVLRSAGLYGGRRSLLDMATSFVQL